MKRKLQTISGIFTASLLALGVSARETHTVQTETKVTRERTVYGSNEKLGPTDKASDIIGREVKNYQNEKLGKVDNLAIDVESGRIVQVILSIGGMFGVGDHMIAVPPSVLHHDAINKVVHFDANKEKLKSAPRFDSANWTESSHSNRVTVVYQHYGQRPYFVTQEGEASIRKEDPTNTRSVRNADGTWSEVKTKDGRSSPSGLGYIQKASKVIGLPVKNKQEEKLGTVENLIVDLAAGRIVGVVVSSGGFLGMGDELSAMPPTAFRFNTTHDILQLDASKDALARAPHFKSSQWPDFSQPGYAAGMYRAYNVEPYFSASVTTSTDPAVRNLRDRNDRVTTPGQESNNSKSSADKNIRNRDENSVTSLDQGSSPADRNLTAQVRQEIMLRKNLSADARNIKVSAVNGRVTLRGTVISEEERRALVEIASRLATAEHVDNELVVRLNEAP